MYLYADETGNPDYAEHTGSGATGATSYFGFGTAVFYGDHGRALMSGLELRVKMAQQGFELPKGFHAKNDSPRTRMQVFDAIRALAPRFDTTFLYKKNAYSAVRSRGEMYLYRLAWYLHFKEIPLQVAEPEDNLYVIAGSFGTNRRLSEAKQALSEVCGQVDRNITLCVWDSPSSWGLQIADYALWATQKHLEGRQCSWFRSHVAPTLHSAFTPWGTLEPSG